jgi:hypothetical protein
MNRSADVADEAPMKRIEEEKSGSQISSARCSLALAFLVGLTLVAGWSGPSRAAAPLASAGTGKPAAPRFETDVAPILEAKCRRCHGGKIRKAGLDLSTPATIGRGGESGAVVVPGRPEESPLFEMVRDGEMPADKKGLLTEAEVDAIRRWIEAGAPATTEPAGPTRPPANPEVTQHDVIPILLRRCTVCHGASQREGRLDLRSRAAMLRGGKSGPALVPGDPEASLILEKIRAGAMPPKLRVVEVSVKPIEPAETEVLARWIALGAPETVVEPDVAGTAPDPLVSDQDRDFWSFRPPGPILVPAVRHAERVRNPIDAFVLERLESNGLSLSPEANRLVLLRRVAFDLTGLPPEPDEVDAFLADRDPLAYEKQVDRLLASPRYGERWGRHWLDLAGYADSEGKREQDLPRPFAYLYRDYVIRAFNADKPYDRFLLEQLAGDELRDYAHAPETTPEIQDNLVATGFLRMAPDPTWANITNFVPDRVEVVADEIDVLGSAVLGLTLKCARCHSHKFDPIPQRDYYRLAAVFKGAFDEYDWLRPAWNPPISTGRRADRDLAFVRPEERRRREAYNGALQREIDALRSALDRKAEGLQNAALARRLATWPAVLRDGVRAALAPPAGGCNPIRSLLAARLARFLRLDRDALKEADSGFRKQSEETVARTEELEARRLPEPRIRALWDRGAPSPTYIAQRGDPTRPGRLVGPGVPSVLTDGRTPFEVRPPWPGAESTGQGSGPPGRARSRPAGAWPSPAG